MQNWCKPAKGSSISDSIPAARCDSASGCALDQVVRQRGLADPGLAAQHEDTALTCLRVFEHAVKRLALAAPVSRADLLREVWGTSYDGGSNTVDVVIRSLRRKLGAVADRIETVRGVGYRLR